MVCDCLRLSMVYVMDTHIHRPVYSLTVVLKRPPLSVARLSVCLLPDRLVSAALSTTGGQKRGYRHIC